MAEPDYVQLDVDERGIAVLTLDNPPLNLTTLTTLNRLLETCRRIAEDIAIRVLIVTGSGDKAFCAGSDVKEFSDVREQVAERKLAHENEAFTAIENLPVPVIAALNGVTLGGGGEIALACDIRIMDETTRIGFPEVKLGVFPGSGGVFRLPRLIGRACAFELLYTGDLIDAGEALRIGLVNRLAPKGRALDAARDLARTLVDRPALALSLIRSGVRNAERETTEQATLRTLADSQRVFTGPDIEEGLAAFFEKRPPVFTAPRPREEEQTS